MVGTPINWNVLWAQLLPGTNSLKLWGLWGNNCVGLTCLEMQVTVFQPCAQTGSAQADGCLYCSVGLYREGGFRPEEPTR